MKQTYYFYRGQEFTDLWYAGRHYRLSDTDLGLNKRKPKEAAGSGDNRAPLPGKILQVLKQVNEACNEGEVIIVMEAMKMEYKIKAPASGTVQNISVKAGDIVALGTELFKLA